MKRIMLSLALIVCLLTENIYAQINMRQLEKKLQTSIGLVIYSNDTETVWNALRLANYSKNLGDTVCVFLLGKGVEVDSLVEENKDIKEQAELFLNNGGTILGCGTCLSSRKNNEPKICRFSSLADLYGLIRNNDIILTF